MTAGRMQRLAENDQTLMSGQAEAPAFATFESSLSMSVLCSTTFYSARTITSQCHSAPQITVISLKLWRFVNYITYLLTYSRPMIWRTR